MSLFLFWVVLKSMDIFTQHGDVYIVPDFYGQTLEQLHAKGYDAYFEFEIIDSVYFKMREKGTVVLQNPLPGSKVKQGRHVYLTIVAQSPEKVLMPNLKNLSLRQALVTLESAGLLVGRLEYIEYFARNAVIDQLIGEEPVETDTELLQGTSINLVLGKGDYTVMVPMPFLIALKQSEVKQKLHYNSLNVGREYYLDDDDTAHARVYKTDPEALSEDMLYLGQPVNIWYRSDELIDFKEYLLQFEPDTITSDPEDVEIKLEEDEF
ncbi:MAG: PASTA domain-containing protein [Bacteroidetes bacterium]|nr:PASTA domain-containing protein [Bacteroidota bacterium]MBL6944229.1 PASTA domain-containing protein [Bacteroidales bacterium]